MKIDDKYKNKIKRKLFKKNNIANITLANEQVNDND